MSDFWKGILVAVGAYVLLELQKAKKEGRDFHLSDLPILAQVANPTTDPLPNTDASYSGYREPTMEQTLQAIDANPNLVADLTPQGQYRVDTRATY